jgi:hypothetical protein
MLKQTITYMGHDERVVTETLYFNITKTELMDHLDLMDTLEEIKKFTDGVERELTRSEIALTLDFVKTIMKLSYGIRLDDGKRFRKNDEVWAEFIEKAAYDAFLMSLFEPAENAINFILGCFPADLVAEATAEIEKNEATTNVETVELPAEPPVLAPPTPSVETEMPPEKEITALPEKKSTDFTRDQLLAMPQEEFQAIVGSDIRKMTQQELAIAMQRRSEQLAKAPPLPQEPTSAPESISGVTTE